MFGTRKEKKKEKLKRIEECISAKSPNYSVGLNSYGCPAIFEWGEGAALKVGAFCSIGPNVTVFLGGEHRTDWVSTYPFNQFWSEAAEVTGHPFTRGDVVIGNNVWIGFGATIMSGVTIGDGAVIGAQAVIAKDVEPYAIVAGNPAKMIRKRFSDETIRKLQEAAWWDWPERELRNIATLLMSGNIEEFLRYAEKR